MAEERPVTLVDLGGGAAVELFDMELERVIKNIADVNTDPTATRVINLKVTIKPDQHRALGNVHIACTSKLSSGRGNASVFYFVKRPGGQVEAIESNPQQTTFENVKPMPLKGV